MQKFDSNLILLIFVELAVVYLLAAMLAADGWVIYRLFTGKPVLPHSRESPRGRFPGGRGPFYWCS